MGLYDPKLLERPDFAKIWQKAGFRVLQDGTNYNYETGKYNYTIKLDMDPYLANLSVGQQCPCNNAHQLEPTKERLVYYQNRVWAYNCALKEGIQLAAEAMLDTLQKVIDSEASQAKRDSKILEIQRTIREMASVMVSKFIRHEEGCRAELAGAAMRGTSKCTCEMEKQQTKLLDISADLGVE